VLLDKNQIAVLLLLNVLLILVKSLKMIGIVGLKCQCVPSAHYSYGILFVFFMYPISLQFLGQIKDNYFVAFKDDMHVQVFIIKPFMGIFL